MKNDELRDTEKNRSGVDGENKKEGKYFRIEQETRGLRVTPWRIWVNESVLKTGWRPESSKPFHGLRFQEPPKISFDRKGRRGAIWDAYGIMLGIWLISDRLKELLESLDLDAFAFVKAEVDYSNFETPGPEFWFCDFVRLLDCIDEDNSEIEFQKNVPFKNYISLSGVRLRHESVGRARAFRLQYSPLVEIVDEIFVKKIREEKFNCFRFFDVSV